MSEHSIEELKRQYDEAASRRTAAVHAERLAHDRLRTAHREAKLAEIEAAGIVIGVTPLRLWQSWYGDEKEIAGGPFFIIGVENGLYGFDAAVVIAKAKKDGTASKAKAVVRYSRCEPVA